MHSPAFRPVPGSRPNAALGWLNAAFAGPFGQLAPSQRETFLDIQVEASRPAYSAVLMVGSVLLLILAALEALGWASGIGYPVWLTASAGVLLAVCGMVTLHVRNPLLFALSMVIYCIGLAALTSLPISGSTSGLSFRIDLFNLFPIAALSLTVRRPALWMIIGLIAAVAVFRITAYAPPASGVAIYWLVIATSVMFGLLLRRFRFNFAVHSYLAGNQLRSQAQTDSLTGLLNRNGWNPAADDLLEQADRRQRPTSAIFFDLDHFKHVNDTHGHQAGDLVLQKFAAIVMNVVRDVDIAGRTGGEEFAILLPETDKEAALGVAQRLHDAIRGSEVTLRSGVSLRFTSSIGVAFLDDGMLTLDALLEHADLGLYQAKHSGRNRTGIVGQTAVHCVAPHDT